MDGSGKYGITNYNSIGIELCVNSDGDYNKAFDNTIKLTKMLMKKYNIPASRVVRHYDASRKMCPYSMSSNNWAKWNQFKNSLNDTTSGNVTINKNEGTILADVLNVRSGAGTTYSVLGQLIKGDKVRINKEVNDWYDIYYGESGGYVSKQYVETNFGKEESKPVNKEEFDMDKIVLYAGDADAFAAFLVSQKYRCALMKASDYEAKNIKAKEVIRIGGKAGTDRYDSLKEAAKLV